MVHRHISASESYSVLGLSEGVSLEVVKSTYKQLALKTHPDKNPGNADATARFQRLSEAYNALLKHLDTSASPSLRAYNPFTRREYDSEDEDDYYSDEDDEDDEDGYDYYDDDYESDDDQDVDRMDFFMFLFEEVMKGRGSRYSRARFNQQCDCPYHLGMREKEPRETPEEYVTRIRRAREEQEAAEERRKQEDAFRRAEQERERENERREAEERQKAKASKKKANAELSRKTAENKARAQQERVQTRRSLVFAAARKGDIDAVKKGIWEDEVDAAGGEVKQGCEAFVKIMPKDPRETLSHIAANNNYVDLVEWIDTHGADPEERDSQGLTAFHVALRKGHIKVVKYILEAHPPEDATSVYERPPKCSVIDLAIESHLPEAVWLTFEHKLADRAEMDVAWANITSSVWKQAFLRTRGLEKAEAKLREITILFASFGKFTKVSEEVESQEESSTEAMSASFFPTSANYTSQSPLSQAPRSFSPLLDTRKESFYRKQGQTRGRGRGRGRARGFRGRGTGSAS